MYELVYEQIGDGVQIIKNSIMNIKTIEIHTKGYTWYPELGISVQGVDTNKALLEIVTQCQKNKINIEITLFKDRIIKIIV